MSSYVIYGVLMLAAGIGVPILAAMNARTRYSACEPATRGFDPHSRCGRHDGTCHIVDGTPKNVEGRRTVLRLRRRIALSLLYPFHHVDRTEVRHRKCHILCLAWTVGVGGYDRSPGIIRRSANLHRCRTFVWPSCYGGRCVLEREALNLGQEEQIMAFQFLPSFFPPSNFADSVMMRLGRCRPRTDIPG